MSEQEFTHAIGVAIYQSGRKEEFECRLRVCGTPTKKFSQKVSDLKSFPTVKKVTVTKVNK